MQVLRDIWLFVLTVVVIPAWLSITAAQQPVLNERNTVQESNLSEVIMDANNITIVVTYDNNPYKEGLGTAWGFSCVITGMEKTILFDTGGDGRMLLENMSKLGIDPNVIEVVVLSHIHGDHTGGLELFLQKNSNVAVCLPKSFPQEFKDMVNSYGANIIEVEKHTGICRDVYSTGQLGTSIKEQGLIVRTEKGVVLVTGCAHPGIVEMTKRSKEVVDEDILLVMGGFHLRSATEAEVENIIRDLKTLKVQYAGPCHCTGDNSRTIFAKRYGPRYINIGAGRRIVIEDLQRNLETNNNE